KTFKLHEMHGLCMPNLLLNPDIHGDRIIFVCCDDLWEHDLKSGSTRKIVSNLGVINNARFFPDGRKIAIRVMRGSSLNTADLYFYNGENGEIKRITYFSGKSTGRRMFTDVAGFDPDGNLIISTDAMQPFSSMTCLYRVENDGINFVPLNLGPATHILFADGRRVIGRNTFELPHWKGYRGGTRGKIWIEVNSGAFKKIVDMSTHVSSPVIVGHRIYFITDIDGFGQIYSTDLDGKDLRKHTSFTDYYPRHLNTDGRRILFSKGGSIYIFNPDTEKIEKIEIGDLESPEDRIISIPSKFAEDFSPLDGDLIAFVSRGQAFIQDVSGTYVLKVPEPLRIRYVRRGGDTKVAFIHGTREGDFLGIYDYRTGKAEKFEENLGNVFAMGVDRNGKFAVVANDRFEIMTVDLETGKPTVIERSREAMITDFTISDNSRFIAYGFPLKHGETDGYVMQAIHVYDMEGRKIFAATTENSHDYAPAFDADSKNLYYLSYRSLDPSPDRVVLNFSFEVVSKPFVIPLIPGSPNPTKLVPRSMTSEAGEYDLNDMYKRSSPINVDPGDYRMIIPLESSILIYSVPVHGEFAAYYQGAPEKGVLLKYDVKTRKVTEVKNNLTDLRLSADRKTVMVRKDDGKIYTFPLEKPEDERTVETDKRPLVSSIHEEFLQMYDEAWKLARDNYWNEAVAKEISERIYEKYRNLVPLCKTRYDLSNVIVEMQGEYRTSHSYEMGGTFTDKDPFRSGRIACDFKLDGDHYVVAKAYAGDYSNEGEKSPIFEYGIDPTGYLIEDIDGETVGAGSNIYRVLSEKAGTSARIRLSGKGGDKRDLMIDILDDDRFIRYRSWVEANRRYVHERSKGTIGYIHIPDMGMMGLNEFYRLFINESSYQGLIVDVRFNGGGFVSQLIIEKLMNKRIGYDNPRRGTLSPYPTNSVRGKIIAITNEYAGSDGDIFSFSFKKLGLGKLIGTRTWGGVVGITPKRRLIDGTVLTQPEFAFWFRDAGFGVENYGVDPDVEIEYAPHDYLSGKDPQIDYAIDALIEELRNWNEELPQRPS
nr:Chain A, tricorn protease [Thermoplasma acidophilum]1K32_B Chain B, tricorn protease [Thermoplasma acidophilum]1K32_C Chain C, tricorn protease [Thermoplasma acidophilum]1K32_D Chain D, tricorn protease [Thermoplasma acidophilum]1K32_E Chain E, tricorn protease [Thermoplasma acidophilum]1K32_F Chain F, tricorn protease [Thermoplasma acidophilum]